MTATPRNSSSRAESLLTTTNGYDGEARRGGRRRRERAAVASTTGVKIRGKEGSVTADSIEVLDNGKHIFLRGNVKVVYHPPETPDKDASGGTAEAPPALAPATIEAVPDGST